MNLANESERSPSITRPMLVITVGLPGSGKSSWLAAHGHNAISSDEVRRLLIDDPADQTIHNRVFATIRHLVRQRLAIRRPVTYVDATHLTEAERKPYIKIAKWFACDIDVLFFDVPLDECLRRNSFRSRVVPPEAIEMMALKLKVPEMSEGFRRISSIHVERSSNPGAEATDSYDSPASGHFDSR